MVEVSADIEGRGIGGRCNFEDLASIASIKLLCMPRCLLDDSDRVRDLLLTLIDAATAML